MTAKDTKNQVRDALAAWAQAASRKDLDAIMACYAPDVRAFDAIMALQFQGAAAYREHWALCLGFAPGAMRFEVHDLTVETAGDLAVCHYLANCGCTDENGVDRSGWMRATAGLRRIGGKWLIAHEHFSAPFDPESGKALFELQPAPATVQAA